MKAVEIVQPLHENFAGDSLRAVASALRSANVHESASAVVLLLRLVCDELAETWDAPVTAETAAQLKQTFFPAISALASAIDDGDELSMLRAANGLARRFA